MVQEFYKILSNEEEEEIARDESQLTYQIAGGSNPTFSQVELLEGIRHMNVRESTLDPNGRPSTSVQQPHRQHEAPAGEVQQGRAPVEKTPLQPTAQARHQAMPLPSSSLEPPGPTGLQPRTQQIAMQTTPISDRKRKLLELYESTEQEITELNAEITELKAEITELKAKLGQKEQNEREAKAEIEELRGKALAVEGLLHQVQGLQRERDTAIQQLAHARQQLEDARQGHLADTSRQNQERGMALGILQNQFEDAERNLSRMREQRDAERANALGFKKAIEDFENRIGGLRAAAAQEERTKRIAAEQECSDLQAAVQEERTKRIAAEYKCRKLEQKAEENKKRAKIARDALEGMTAASLPRNLQ